MAPKDTFFKNPDKIHANTYHLIAGWLIDGTGGPVQKNVLIRIHEGFIQSVENWREPDSIGSESIGYPSNTIIPLLVDSHTHLFMSGTANQDVRKEQLNAPFERIEPIILKHMIQNLDKGIAAVRDGGDYAGHSLRFKHESLPKAGLPAFIYSAGKAWRAPHRYGRLIGRPPLEGDTLARSIGANPERVDHVKIVNSGLNSLKVFAKETAPQFTFADLKAAVHVTTGLGLKTMVHANGQEPVRVAVEAGCDSIEHGFFMGRDNLKNMAQRQTLWVPTVFTMKAYAHSDHCTPLEKEIARKNLNHQLNQISEAVNMGVHLAAGSDCGSLGVHHGIALSDEVNLLMEAGLSIEKAIQCASGTGAKLLGLPKELGTLKPGMPASFVVLEGPPEDLTTSMKKPLKIFIKGRELDRKKLNENFPH